jgi:hypothetical protein
MSAKIKIALVVALLAGSGSSALAGSHYSSEAGRFAGGREIDAPWWSFACQPYHGPSSCAGQKSWVYGPVN